MAAADDILVIFHSASGRSSERTGMPTAYISDSDIVYESVANPTSSTQTTNTSPHQDGTGFVTVVNRKSVRVVAKAGTNPTATATSGFPVMAGGIATYAIKKGHLIALIVDN